MKKLLYLAAFAALAVTYSCSYEDLSTEAGQEIADIVVTSTDDQAPVVTEDNYYDLKADKVGKKLYLGDVLELNPDVKYSDGTEGDFSYEWQIPMSAFASSTQYNEPYMTIGHEKKLSWTVETVNPNSSTPYLVRLIVTDNKTGQIKMAIFHAYVLENIQQGICLAYSVDGKTSDIALFRDETVTTDFASSFPGKDVVSDLTMYSTCNGGKYDGIITGLHGCSWVMNGASKKILLGWSRDKLFAQKTETHVNIKSAWEDWFYYTPSVIDVETYIPFGSYGLLFSDNSYYMISNPSSFYPVRKFGLPSYGSQADARSKGTVAKYNYDNHISYALQLAYMTFFDNNSGNFYYYATSSDICTAQTPPKQKNVDQLSGYTDWEVVSSTTNLGSNDNNRFLMRRKGTTDEFALMIMDRLANYKNWILLDPAQVKANHFDEAAGYYVDNRDACLHYWTSDNTLYSVYYTITGVFSFKECHKFDSEITGMWPFRQRSRTLPGKQGYTDGNAIAIATSKSQTEGTLYTVKYANATDSDLNFDDYHTYTVPGRISAFIIED